MVVRKRIGEVGLFGLLGSVFAGLAWFGTLAQLGITTRPNSFAASVVGVASHLSFVLGNVILAVAFLLSLILLATYIFWDYVQPWLQSVKLPRWLRFGPDIRVELDRITFDVPTVTAGDRDVRALAVLLIRNQGQRGTARDWIFHLRDVVDGKGYQLGPASFPAQGLTESQTEQVPEPNSGHWHEAQNVKQDIEVNVPGTDEIVKRCFLVTMPQREALRSGLLGAHIQYRDGGKKERRSSHPREVYPGRLTDGTQEREISP